MSFPSIPSNLHQERAGILAVAAEINRLGLIWRETPMVDIGIDGQIEFVGNEGKATGQLVAVQIKSGPSYFHDNGAEWRFYPASKHRDYWKRFPLPVLVFLHSPADGSTYWADARQALRNPRSSSTTYVGVPKHNRLGKSTAEELFSNVGASSRPILPLEEVLRTLVTTVSPSGSFPLSHFDLFANGLTNIGRSIYYGVDMAMEVAQVLLEESPLEEYGVGIGHPEHEFLFAFVRFLVEQHLADVNISDCLIDWIDREKHPTFVAPLTTRGRDLVRVIHQMQRGFERDGRLQVPPLLTVAQEDFVRMAFTSSHYSRIPLIRRFQEIVISAG